MLIFIFYFSFEDDLDDDGDDDALDEPLESKQVYRPGNILKKALALHL